MGKVLVTGANGFIGSHLVEALLNEGYQVRALVRKTSNLNWLAGLPIEFVYGSITDFDTLLPAVTDVNFICHTAGITKAKNPDEYGLVNYGGTENLLKACVIKNPQLKRFVHISSLAAVGPAENSQIITEEKSCFPISNYGTSKLQAESAVLAYKDKLPVVIVRLSAIYGPRDKETLTYFQFLKKGIRPIWGGSFSLCYVKDAVRAIVLCLQKEVASGSIYYIADPQCYTYDAIAEIAESLLNKKTVRIKIPNIVLLTYIQILNKLAKNKSVISSDRINDLTAKCWACDCQKAEKELGFTTKYSLRDGLWETIQWYQNQGWL